MLSPETVQALALELREARRSRTPLRQVSRRADAVHPRLRIDCSMNRRRAALVELEGRVFDSAAERSAGPANPVRLKIISGVCTLVAIELDGAPAVEPSDRRMPPAGR